MRRIAAWVLVLGGLVLPVGLGPAFGVKASADVRAAPKSVALELQGSDGDRFGAVHVRIRADGGASGMAIDSVGAVWLSGVGGLVRVSPEDGSRTVVPLQGHSAGRLATGGDGAIWFTTGSNGVLGRVSSTGEVGFMDVPVSAYADIVAGPDGVLWSLGSGVVRIATDGTWRLFEDPDMDFRGGVSALPAPARLTVGIDGVVWVVMPAAGALGRLDPRASASAGFQPVTGAALGMPTAVAVAPDGTVWFTNSQDRLGRLGSGYVPVDVMPLGCVGPNGILVGPDGALYVSAFNGSLARVTVDGVVENVWLGLPPVGRLTGIVGMVIGSDQHLWLATVTGEVRRLELGSLLEHVRAAADAVAAGPDGAIWFVNWRGLIGRVGMDRQVTTFEPPELGSPSEIVAGPDGALWSAGGVVARTTTDGDTTAYLDDSIVDPVGLVVGPDGAIWFANRGSDSVGRIDTAGNVSEFRHPGIRSPQDLAVGPDGALWFTNAGDGNAGTVGRISVAGAVTVVVDEGIVHPTSILAGTDGDLWFLDLGDWSLWEDDAIVQLTADGVIERHPVGYFLQAPRQLASGPGGSVLIVGGPGSGYVGQVTASGAIHVISSDESLALPSDVVSGPDGGLWVANAQGGGITRIALAHLVSAPAAMHLVDIAAVDNGAFVADYSLDAVTAISGDGTLASWPLPGAGPKSISIDSQGAVWYAGYVNHEIGRLGPGAAQQVYEDPATLYPTVVLAAPDGIWYGGLVPGGVAHRTPDGTIATYRHDAIDGVQQMVGSDHGGVWFSDGWTPVVGRVSPDGSVTAMSIPDVEYADLVGAVPGGGALVATEGRLLHVAEDGSVWTKTDALPTTPTDAVADATGALWLALGDSVGYLDTAGRLLTFEVPTGARSIDLAPDGTLWTIGSGGIATVVTSPPPALSVCGESVAGPFSDVGALHPFCREIEWLVGGGVASGYDDGSFRPSSAVTRQAMASFVWRYEGQPGVSSAEPFFADVPAGHPFFGAIQWMAESGLSTGSPNPAGGKPLFKPGDRVSRQAMAAFLWRHAGQPASSLPGPFFADVPATSPFVDPIQWMAGSGLSLGTPNPPGKPLYKPSDPVSRQAMAAFLYRYDQSDE